MSRIALTHHDLRRLRAILGSRTDAALDREHLLDLSDELDRARIIPEQETPTDLVRLGSTVRVRDRQTGVSSEYTIVMPAQADLSVGHVSVIAPLGTALLGYREGDEVAWRMPGGVRRLLIERVGSSHELGPGDGAEVPDPPIAA